MRGSNSRHIFNTFRAFLVGLASVVTIVVAQLVSEASAAEQDMCKVAEQALQEASRIRGIKAKEQVPCVVRTRAEVEGFLKETIAEKFPKDTLLMEQLVYRAIGMVPDEYDYVNGIVQAYVQQIGGYYDPEKNQFVMVDTMPPQLQYPVAVHELTHALQDQRFNLERFLDPSIRNNDELMARAALVEGDATAVMQDFMRAHKSKVSARDSELAAPGPKVPVPRELERALLFPYVQGLSFVLRVSREGGFAAINDGFARPPRSSREVLHPEQYITRAFSPSDLDARELEMPARDSVPLYTDVIGEFLISALIGTALSSDARGEECAQGWLRDRIAVFKDKDGESVVSWTSEWESSQEAEEFYECYREMLKARYQKDVRGDFIDVTPAKRMKINASGRRVSVVIGMG
jgi:hypothetical protein